MGKTKSSTKKKKNTDLFEIDEIEINQRQKEYVNGILVEKINLTAKTDSQKKLLKSIKENPWRPMAPEPVASPGISYLNLYV